MLFILTMLQAHALQGVDQQPNCTADTEDPFAFGQGIDEDPWLVCSAAQLNSLNALSGTDSALSDSYRMINDIDMAGEAWSQGIGVCNPVPAPPTAGFMGRFDGGGYAITGLTVVSSLWNPAGLFSCLGTAEVVDLTVEDITVEATSAFFSGGLAGHAYNAVIEDVTVIGGSIVGDLTAGGLLGVARDSVLMRTGFEGTVTAVNNSGGLVGMIEWSRIEDSYAWGSIESTFNLGGLTAISNGVLGDVEILRSHASMNFIGADSAFLVGNLIALRLGVLFLGSSSGDLDAVLALEVDDLPLIGSETSIDGVAVALPRETMLETSTFERAGWDLEVVWNPPTRTSPPTLR